MKTKNESTVWMTASMFARHRAVSRQHIARLVKTGVLPMRGNLINAVEADRLLDDRADAREPAAGDQASRYAEARTIRTVFQAKLARLEFETRQGKLIEADSARARIQEHLAAIRIGLEGLTERLSGPIASERDARKVRGLMTAEITKELHRLSAILSGRGDIGVPPEG
jgi:hypothetical protein